MGTFYKLIVLRALANTPALISSNWLAVLVSILIFMATVFMRIWLHESYKNANAWRAKLRAVREQLRPALRGGAVLTICAWVLLFIVSLTRTVYQDHRELTNQVSSSQQERDKARIERDSLKAENDTLKNKPKQCWRVNHFGPPNPSIKEATGSTEVIMHCNYRIEAPFGVQLEFDSDFVPGYLIIPGAGTTIGGTGIKDGKVYKAHISLPSLLPDQVIVATVYGQTQGQYPRALQALISPTY
jgi:hypothetical protein